MSLATPLAIDLVVALSMLSRLLLNVAVATRFLLLIDVVAAVNVLDSSSHALVVDQVNKLNVPPPYVLAEGQGSWYEMRDACAASGTGANPRIIAVPTSQEQVDAVRALVEATHGDVRHWIGYSLPRGSEPRQARSYVGLDGHTMRANGFTNWAPYGRVGTSKSWDRCVHARESGAGWFMQTCSGPYVAVCQELVGAVTGTWVAGALGGSCTDACASTGNRCTEATLADGNAAISTEGGMNAVLAQLNISACANGWRNNEYGTNDNVPNFAPYLAARKGGTMNMTWCAVSAANREEATFDCDATSMPDAKRLCFCAPAE